MNQNRINPRYIDYSRQEVQQLLHETDDRSFFVDVTEDEYEALSEEQKMNGDLYLIYEPELL